MSLFCMLHYVWCVLFVLLVVKLMSAYRLVEERFAVAVHLSPLFSTRGCFRLQMFLTTEAMFPLKKVTVQDIVSPVYQINVHKDMIALLKMQGHQVSNRLFNVTTDSMISDFIMRLQPSLDPKIIIDRVVPEMVLRNPVKAYRIRAILKDLLPNAKQIAELRSEMKDAAKISVKQELVLSLGERMKQSQEEMLVVLRDMAKRPFVEYGIQSAVNYAILKMSQGVLDLDEIIQRAVNLRLVNNIRSFNRIRKAIMNQQESIDRLAWSVLPSLLILDPNMPASQAHKVPTPTPYSQPAMDRYGWQSSYESDIYRQPQDGREFEDLIAKPQSPPLVRKQLKDLITHQLEVIRIFQHALTNSRKLPVNILQPLMRDTAGNLTQVDRILNVHQISDRIITERLVQASVQHQLIVVLIRKALYGSMGEVIDSQQQAGVRINSKLMKEQARQLTERMALVERQISEDMALIPGLDNWEKKALKSIQRVERRLLIVPEVILQVPNMSQPVPHERQQWMRSSLDILNQQLAQLAAIRDEWIPRAGKPSPLLLAKLMGAISILQKKASVFRAKILQLDSLDRIQVNTDLMQASRSVHIS